MAGVLVIACGALAREIVTLIRVNGWTGFTVQCLPADLHNHPARIPAAVQAKIRAARGRFAQIVVAYGDCGTGGELDRVLQAEGVERLPGAHCYAFFAGLKTFAQLADAEPGTFYLTDFLARHFERLVIQGLGLAQHPQLLPLYFGHYRRLIYLAQTHDPVLQTLAQAAAVRLGLAYHYRYSGYGELQNTLAVWAATVD